MSPTRFEWAIANMFWNAFDQFIKSIHRISPGKANRTTVDQNNNLIQLDQQLEPKQLNNILSKGTLDTKRSKFNFDSSNPHDLAPINEFDWSRPGVQSASPKFKTRSSSFVISSYLTRYFSSETFHSSLSGKWFHLKCS